VRTVNKTVKDQLTAWGVPQKNISTVPSFYLDHNALTPDPAIKKEYGVCFAGRLVAHKGLSDVIKAVVKLPACRLLIVGDGPMRNAAEVHVRDLGADNFITFTGWLDTYEDVIRAMQSAKIFVMNSLSEGGPRVALEAMALGIPVISTNVGIMPDIIHDGVNGLLSNGTSTDLAVKMQRLLADSSLAAKIGIEGRKTALQHFEKRTLIKNYADFLKNLVHSHHS
jgi:glycosyltransferase involved in cell wall biosynthesis